LTLKSVIDCTAKGLYDAIVNYFKSNKVPYKENLKAFAADNASTMVRKHESVAARLKKDIPSLIIIWCTCDSLTRCAKYAAKRIPAEVEDILRRVHLYFKLSSKRQYGFEQEKELLNLKIKKILKLYGTRRLSLSNCVRRFLDLLSPLRKFITKELESFKNSFCLSAKETVQKAEVEFIFNSLQNPLTEMYLGFLAYVLPLICNISLEFQSEAPRIFKLYDRLNDTCRII